MTLPGHCGGTSLHSECRSSFHTCQFHPRDHAVCMRHCKHRERHTESIKHIQPFKCRAESLTSPSDLCRHFSFSFIPQRIYINVFQPVGELVRIDKKHDKPSFACFSKAILRPNSSGIQPVVISQRALTTILGPVTTPPARCWLCPLRPQGLLNMWELQQNVSFGRRV